ncbi:MAG: type IX secretion system membrane protein PorP/SprF, partial [Saprospiraceae bacterium]|nr:type IX secretion system membrane protein PorP/SprF [Saprospiraceae bacterium]
MYKDSILSQSNTFGLNMNVLRHFIVALSVVATVSLSAQQLPLFTQYREFNSAVNPAGISSDYMAFGQNGVVGASYRVQWREINASPRTAFFRGDYLSDQNRGINMLAGGHIIHDQTGPISLTGAYGRIGGVISDDPSYGGISIGLSAGVVQYRLNANELRV